MDIKSMQLFINLAEQLHFGRAATRSHLSASAATRMIQRAAHTLDFPDRTIHHRIMTARRRQTRCAAHADADPHGLGIPLPRHFSAQQPL